MTTHEYRDRDGRVISFEIRNIGRSRATRVIESTFPCAIVKRYHSDAFAEIDLNGKCFLLNEPWGDNSRYIIHQEPPGPSTELEELRHAFEQFLATGHSSWCSSLQVCSSSSLLSLRGSHRGWKGTLGVTCAHNER